MLNKLAESFISFAGEFGAVNVSLVFAFILFVACALISNTSSRFKKAYIFALLMVGFSNFGFTLYCLSLA